MSLHLRSRRTFSFLILGILLSLCVWFTIVWENKLNTHGSIRPTKGRHFNVLHYGDETAAEVVNEDDQEEEMLLRKWLIEDVCRHVSTAERSKEFQKRELDHIIVNDRHKILYCYIPKVACTNWKRIMMILTTNTTVNPLDITADESHHQNFLRTLDNFTFPEIQYRLRNYYKFMFVRHPFERLVSAFRNKFQQNYSSYFKQRFGKNIVKKYRKNATAEALNSGADVQFDEFIRYLMDPETLDEGPFNEHWRPSAHLCHPCRIEYDVIGKYETIEEDAEYVLQRINASEIVEFPKVNKTVDTTKLTEEFMGNLTKDALQKLYELYEMDFKMFHYEYGDLGMRALE